MKNKYSALPKTYRANGDKHHGRDEHFFGAQE